MRTNNAKEVLNHVALNAAVGQGQIMEFPNATDCERARVRLYSALRSDEAGAWAGITVSKISPRRLWVGREELFPLSGDFVEKPRG